MSTRQEEKIEVYMLKSRLILPVTVFLLAIFCTASLSAWATDVEMLTTKRGGGGDQTNVLYYDARCSGDSVITGIVGNTGSFLMSPFSIFCSKVYPDGKFVPGYAVTPWGSGSTARQMQEVTTRGTYPTTYQLICADDVAARGISGRSGWRIDNLSVQCGKLGMGTNGKITVTAAGATVGPAWSASGGDAFSDTCPYNYPAVGVKVSYYPVTNGYELNTIQLICLPPSNPVRYSLSSFNVGSTSIYPGGASKITASLNGPAGPNGDLVSFRIYPDNTNMAVSNFDIPAAGGGYGYYIPSGQTTATAYIRAKSNAAPGSYISFYLSSENASSSTTYKVSVYEMQQQPSGTFQMK